MFQTVRPATSSEPSESVCTNASTESASIGNRIAPPSNFERTTHQTFNERHNTDRKDRTNKSRLPPRLDSAVRNGGDHNQAK